MALIYEAICALIILWPLAGPPVIDYCLYLFSGNQEAHADYDLPAEDDSFAHGLTWMAYEE